MYKVYFINFGYFSDRRFDTLEAAKEWGKSKGFEFTVYDENDVVQGTWGVFSGWRKAN